MTPSSTPTEPTFSRLLEISSHLHGVNSPSEYFEQLESDLPEISGCSGFTWLALESGEGAVLYSSEIRGLSDRLHPPRLDSGTLAVLLGRSSGTFGTRGTLQAEIEGRLIDFREIWRLPGEANSLLLLHSPEAVMPIHEDAAVRRAFLASLGLA